MAQIRLDVISIGTLARNLLWREQHPVRTAHTTTTLIRAGKRHIIVDPGLPPLALRAHLFERTGLSADKIDTIFLTNFRPAHRAGLDLFPKAKRLIHEVEQQTARQQIETLVMQAPVEDEDRKLFEQDLELLETFEPADDRLTAGVDLFPLFGCTAGTSGLLISQPTITTLIAGDAIPSQDHFLAGQVLPDSYDIKAAQDSLQEAYDIADLIVPGYDNIFVSPAKGI